MWFRFACVYRSYNMNGLNLWIQLGRLCCVANRCCTGIIIAQPQTIDHAQATLLQCARGPTSNSTWTLPYLNGCPAWCDRASERAKRHFHFRTHVHTTTLWAWEEGREERRTRVIRVRLLYFFETIYRQTQLSRDTNRPNRAMINHCIVFCAVIPICHPIRTNHHTGPATKKKPPWENRNRSVHRYYRHWKLNFNLPV